MKIAVLGTGDVGLALATKLAAVGHAVVVGSRDAGNPRAAAWSAQTGGEHANFADAAAAGELIVNATNGLASPLALASAGEANLADKVLVDVANPLDFSGGFPPRIATFDAGVSLAEHLQLAFPAAHVVKTLCTVNNAVMVDPARVPGHHHLFLSGDDIGAKTTTTRLLHDLGWAEPQIIDLGGLSSARFQENYLGLWLGLSAALGTSDLNIEVHHAADPHHERV